MPCKMTIYRRFNDLPQMVQKHVLEKHSCNTDIPRYLAEDLTTTLVGHTYLAHRTPVATYKRETARVTYCRLCDLHMISDDPETYKL